MNLSAKSGLRQLTEIKWLAIILVLFFTVIGFVEYAFVKWVVTHTVEAQMSETVARITKQLDYQAGYNPKKFNNEFIDARDAFIVLSNGLILDVESSTTMGVVKGLLPEVAFEGDEKLLYGKSVAYISSIGEKWYLLAKRVSGGRVIIGLSEFDDYKDPEALLQSNANKLNESAKEIAKSALNRIDSAVQFAVIDDAGELIGGHGRLPLKTNPLLIGLQGFGVKNMILGGIPYITLTSPIFDRNGKVAGTIIVPQDISRENQAMQEQMKFTIVLAIFSWLVLFILGARYWNKKEIEKRNIREAFQNYFSPKILSTILEQPEKLKLGGERREITILFSDIRGFTSLSEKLSPHKLTKLLQEYFTEMTEEVLATDGIVDKYIGDSVMAFWGAPLPQDDQVDRAVTTAINMVKRLKALNVKWRSENLPEFNIGIGINFGLATVGNLGSTKRFDYTVVGDTVNTASRIESLNKKFASNIIISESTMKEVTINIETQDLGLVALDGKEIPIRIYRVMCD